jgi:hypothetical protein
MTKRPQWAIFSSARFVVRGPNKPIVAIAIAIAAVRLGMPNRAGRAIA